MEVIQLYTKCLSEAAYFIYDGNEAAVIDPLRDVEAYIDLAKEKNVTIKYIFETHFHADFVSGHNELAALTGAPIVYGPDAQTGFSAYIATDGETFSIGNITLKAIHTPGHTLESTCYLLTQADGSPYCLFTGDTLFVGDVGRPDLFSGNLTKEELASKMYHSLRHKVMTLPDSIIIYPAHGPGSACGKSLGKETFSTLGEQKERNYALQPLTEAEFISEVTSGLAKPPVYFPLNAKINKMGSAPLTEILSKGENPLTAEQLIQAEAQGAWLLDTREAAAFTAEYVPGSINIGLDGRYAEWAGTLLPLNQPLILIAHPGKERESITRLARVGIDNIIGYLDGGIEAWKAAGKAIDMIINVSAEEALIDLPYDDNIVMLDVRKLGEYNAEHVKNAQHLSLDAMADPMNLAMLHEQANYYVYCAGGYRSVIAASMLKREGFHNLRNVLGGYGALQKEGAPIEAPQAV